MKYFGFIILLIASLALGSCSSKKAATSKHEKDQRQEYTGVIPSSDKQVAELIKQARTWIGTPYVYGGHTRKKGTDCSGMIMELFLKVYKLKLPRSSAMQREFSRPVKFKNMEPGDLVFFSTGKNRSRVNHVGLYIGNNRMIHASASRGVMESGLDEKYWRKAYHSSGCVIDTDPKRAKKAPARPDAPSIRMRDLQKLYDALDSQIDSIYVTDPAIFD